MVIHFEKSIEISSTFLSKFHLRNNLAEEIVDTLISELF